MSTKDFYDAIADVLNLNIKERAQLKREFKDPRTLDDMDDIWRGNDVCEYFEREKRRNRSAIDDLIHKYNSLSDSKLFIEHE